MATLVREVKSEVNTFEYEFIPEENPNRLLVKGDLNNHIFYVSNDGFVRQQRETVPFSLNVDLLGLTPDMDLNLASEVEHVSHRLIAKGKEVEQQIIISIVITPQLKEMEITQHFLIRHTNRLKEPKMEEETRTEIQEIELEEIGEHIEDKDFEENIAADELENNIDEEPEIIPIPNLENIVQEKVQERLQKELNQLEGTLKEELELEMEEILQQKLAQLKEEEQKQQQQLQTKRQNRYNEFMKRSIMQQKNGFTVKG